MPMENDDKIKEILKTMVSFDIETDLEDEEARKELINYFSEIVSSDSELIKSFLPKFFNAMTNILVDMDIMEPVGDMSSKDGEEDLSVLGSDNVQEESFQFKLKPIAERANDFLM